MDIYTHVVSAQKHEATGRIVDLLLLQAAMDAEVQHPWSLSLHLHETLSRPILGEIW
jgi:hypothetical protein